MHDEEIIADLFEAARSETPVRELSHIQEFMNTTDMTGTQSNLIFKWLKQYKMNILLTVSAVVITTTIAFFPEQEVPKNIETQQVTETPSVATEAPLEPIVNTKEPMKEGSPIKPQVAKKKSNQQEPLEESALEADNSSSVDSIENSRAAMKVSTSHLTKPVSSVDQMDQPVTEVAEHQILLESKNGQASSEKFEAYLQANLSALNPELTSSANSNLIRKFTLKLDNGLKANFQMQVTGFEKFELHWRTDANNEIKDLWYRLNDNEIKELDLSKKIKSSVKVKHKNSDF